MNILKETSIYICAAVVPLLTTSCAVKKPAVGGGADKALTFVPFNHVELLDEFWLPRLKIQKDVLVPFALEKTRPAVEKLQKAADFLRGDTSALPLPHRYVSSDLYKVMEGAALLLRENPDPQLEGTLDRIIQIISDAQQDDGYLYVAHITGVSKDHDHWGGGGMGDKPYSWVLHSHELYNMGHMYEAAIAYYLSTGKDQWLKVAEKNAQHINSVFFEGDPNYNGGVPVNQAPGHQELEMALVKLHEVTGKQLYLDMAQKFLDIRGRTFIPEGEGVMSPTYSQQHSPVTDQEEAVGHAVRAMYQYSAMAHVSSFRDSTNYRRALQSIWQNMVDTKMHITGGLGAMHGIEGFGPEYTLPNREAYNETCAAVGNVLFNQRMFLMTANAKYLDVAEVALLNNVLAGVNLEGNRFFYVNPLEADGSLPFNHGHAGRSPWFSTACCPSNLARLIPQVSGMMYAHTSKDIYATFYASSRTEIALSSTNVSIEQQTKYPFDETIRFTINPANDARFSMWLRIPTWSQNKFLPGNLYTYTRNEPESWHISVNGEVIRPYLEEGFAVIDREWSKGDQIELIIPMSIKLNKSHDAVEANKGRLAVTRGPLVYCAEGIDQGISVQQIAIDSIQTNTGMQKISEGILKNVVQLTAEGSLRSGEGESPLTIKLIPYYAWNNRGNNSMMVWLPTDPGKIHYRDGNVLMGGKYFGVETSSTSLSGDLRAVTDGRVPLSSDDRSIPVWISDANDRSPWIQIGVDDSKQIHGVKIYWASNIHGTQVPSDWRLELLAGDTWEPLESHKVLGVEIDQYNLVQFPERFNYAAIRIMMTPQEGFQVGVLDIDIDYSN